MDRTVYIGHHFTKLSRLSDQTAWICASLVYIIPLTLILLMWRIWRAPNNASKWQMAFNLAFKGLKSSRYVMFVNNEFCVMFTDCTTVFCVVIRTGIISI
jgi:hypothetical protein